VAPVFDLVSLCGLLCVLPGCAAREVLQEVHSRVLELVPDQAQAQEEHPGIVLGARFAVFPAILAAGALGVQGFRGQRQGQVDVGPDLARMRSSVVEAELQRAGPPNVIKVQIMVAANCRSFSMSIIFR